MIIISYLRRVITSCYKINKVIKFLKGYRAPRASISNINSRKREDNLVNVNSKKEKERRKTLFSKNNLGRI